MPLNEIELLALLAVMRLGDDAYGVPIHEEVERLGGRAVSLAGVYGALDRLTRQGVVRTWQSDPRPERGGRARRHFAVTAAGRDLVRQERERAARMWQDVPSTPKRRP